MLIIPIHITLSVAVDILSRSTHDRSSSLLGSAQSLNFRQQMKKHFLDISQIAGALQTESLQSPLEHILLLRAHLLLELAGHLAVGARGDHGPRTADGLLGTVMALGVCIKKHLILLGDVFLHILEGVAHFRSAADKSDQDLGVSCISLGVTDRQLDKHVSTDLSMFFMAGN